MNFSPSFAIPNITGLLFKWKLANEWEFGTDKPGNVGPSQISDEVSYSDYLRVNFALFIRAEEMIKSQPLPPLGEFIKRLVFTMKQTPPYKNLLLGNIILISPLFYTCAHLSFSSLTPKSIPWNEFWEATRQTLLQATFKDTLNVVEALRYAGPGGMSHPGGEKFRGGYDFKSPLTDNKVRTEQLSLLSLFAKSVDYDFIGREITENYPFCRSWLLHHMSPHKDANLGCSKSNYILDLFLRLLATVPDTLIYRKNTEKVALSIQWEAQKIIDAGSIFKPEGKALFASFNNKLNHSEGQLNPGTTADFLACLLFLGVLSDTLPPLFQVKP